MTETFQSRNDTLENILVDVINKDIYKNTHSNPNPISYQHSGQNSDQKSYVYNGSDEKSVTVNMSAHSYGTHTSGKKKNNIKLILYDVRWYLYTYVFLTNSMYIYSEYFTCLFNFY